MKKTLIIMAALVILSGCSSQKQQNITPPQETPETSVDQSEPGSTEEIPVETPVETPETPTEVEEAKKPGDDFTCPKTHYLTKEEMKPLEFYEENLSDGVFIYELRTVPPHKSPVYIIAGFDPKYLEANPGDKKIRIPNTHNGAPVIEMAGIFDRKVGEEKAKVRPGIFAESNIIEVDFSEACNLRFISMDAFRDNKIKNLDLRGAKNLEIIDQGAFLRAGIETVDLRFLEKLETIGASAFELNDIRELKLQDNWSLKEIEREAFRANELTEVNFSELPMLEFLGDKAFAYNKLTKIDFRDNHKFGRDLENIYNITPSIFKNNGNFITEEESDRQWSFHVNKYLYEYHHDRWIPMNTDY